MFPRQRFAEVLLSIPLLFSVQQPHKLQPAGTFKEPYSRIRGVVELRDGRVLVADQTELAVYIADLNTRTKLGSNGAGPREYRAPVGVFVQRGDTAWIHDLQNRRMVAVTQGGVVGAVTMKPGAATIIPHAVDSTGRLYFSNVSSVRLEKRNNPAAENAVVLRYNGTRTDTVARIKAPGPVNPGPFNIYDHWAIGPDGRIAIVRNQDEYRVDWVDERGATVIGPRVRETRITVTGKDREAYSEKAASGMAPGQGMVSTSGGGGPPPQQTVFPDRFPFAQAIYVSPSGQAWVHRYRHLTEGEPLFDVFDARGNRVGSVTLPAGRLVIGFGRTWLYAVRVDNDGLQWLEQYPAKL